MLRNIGKKIRIVSIALAALFLVAFLVLGIICLSRALGADVNEALRLAGIEAAVLSFLLAIVLPALMILPYGFGCMVSATEKRTEDVREAKELLRKALGEGLLADDIARGVSTAIGNRVQAVATAPVAAAPVGAPYQRPVEEPTEGASAPATQNTPTAPFAKKEVPMGEQGAIRPLRPVNNEESF